MSHGYVAVQWNRNKKIYDTIVTAGIVAVLAIDLLAGYFGTTPGARPSPIIMLIRAFGDTAFILISFILCVGPLARLDRRFLPVLYNRRHMGVSFFILALAHGMLALVWYHGYGVVDPITSLFTSQGTYESVVDYPFQPLGFLALVIFFLMASTSHDYWNANLGAPLWKALHMLVYVAYGLIVSHLALGALQSPFSGLPTWAVWFSLALVGGLHLISGFLGAAPEAHAEPATDWVPVDGWQHIGENRARIMVVGAGERVAIFHLPGNRYAAIGNACQHQNGPLGEGCVQDGLVTCPWHGFQYRLEDGRSPAPFTEKVATYRLKAEGGMLYLNPKALPAGTERPIVEMEAGA